jgi:hypothetical protein
VPVVYAAGERSRQRQRQLVPAPTMPVVGAHSPHRSNASSTNASSHFSSGASSSGASSSGSSGGGGGGGTVGNVPVYYRAGEGPRFNATLLVGLHNAYHQVQ